MMSSAHHELSYKPLRADIEVNIFAFAKCCWVSTKRRKSVL